MPAGNPLPDPVRPIRTCHCGKTVTHTSSIGQDGRTVWSHRADCPRGCDAAEATRRLNAQADRFEAQALAARVAELRTPDVAAVLDLVQRTGLSAHDIAPDRTHSPIVAAAAVLQDCDPVALQAAVEAYCDALDAR